jgi:hypothetical protein
MIWSIPQLGLHQIEQIPDSFHETQFLRSKSDVEFAFDTHDQPNQVDRIETQGFPKVLIVLGQLE